MSETQVKLLFFGEAGEIAGTNETEMSLPSNTPAKTAFEKILQTYPNLEKRFGKSLLFAINQTYSNGDEKISNADELAIFPPVSGG